MLVLDMDLLKRLQPQNEMPPAAQGRGIPQGSSSQSSLQQSSGAHLQRNRVTAALIQWLGGSAHNALGQSSKGVSTGIAALGNFTRAEPQRHSTLPGRNRVAPFLDPRLKKNLDYACSILQVENAQIALEMGKI